MLPSGDSMDDGTSQESQSDSSGAATTAPEDEGTGETATLPSTFPSSDVPLIDGEIRFAIDLGTGWSVVVAADDFTLGFADASTRLTAAGFTAEIEQSSPEGALGVYTSDKYQINVNAGATADFGNAVSYTVVLTG